MGVKEMYALVGKTGDLKVESLKVAVSITDVRKVWQRVDVLVEPVNGSGEQWVSLERVEIQEAV